MVHYLSDGVFDAPLEKIWKYNNSDDHQHSLVRGHSFVSEDNRITMEADILIGDMRTNRATVTFIMNPPNGFDISISRGIMNGARYKHTYTPMGKQTKVVIEGDFPPPPGMDESTYLKMIDEFFTKMFEEDNANLKKMK